MNCDRVLSTRVVFLSKREQGSDRPLHTCARLAAHVVPWLGTLREPRYAGAREGFLTWLRRVLLPGRFPGLEWPEQLELSEDETMLAERVKEWTRVWREEGLEQGLKQGLEQGLERGLLAERRMLLRQIDRRFGVATAAAAEPLLARIDRPEPFEQVGEWVIDCAAAEDFLARLRGLVS